jgi:hypothetical protein
LQKNPPQLLSNNATAQITSAGRMSTAVISNVITSSSSGTSRRQAA